MSSYSVHLEARDEVSDEAIDALMDEIEQRGGIAVGGPGFRTWSVTLTVGAESPMDAINQGASAVTAAATKSGLPVTEFIHCEAVLLEHALAKFPRK
jgi:hypothetical protein